MKKIFTNRKIQTILVIVTIIAVSSSVSFAQSLDPSLNSANNSAQNYDFNTTNDIASPQQTNNGSANAGPTAAGAVGLPSPTKVGNTNTASNQPTSQAVFTLSNPLSGVNSISDLILTFMKVVSYVAVIFGVLMLMWVGMQFVLAQGKPEEIKKRSNELLWIVVGIGVIIGARIIVTVVINTLDSTGTVNSGIIQNAKNAINSQ